MDNPTPTLSESFCAATGLKPGEVLDRKYVLVLTGELDRMTLILASLHRHVHSDRVKGVAGGETTVERTRILRLQEAREASAFDQLISLATTRGEMSLAAEYGRQKAYYVRDRPTL